MASLHKWFYSHLHLISLLKGHFGRKSHFKSNSLLEATWAFFDGWAHYDNKNTGLMNVQYSFISRHIMRIYSLHLLSFWQWTSSLLALTTLALARSTSVISEAWAGLGHQGPTRQAANTLSYRNLKTQVIMSILPDWGPLPHSNTTSKQPITKMWSK